MRFAIRYKPFWNYEKEERWLNDMAARGLALVHYRWIRYVFEASEPGAYIYRIELLESPLYTPESQRYLRFMEDNGVEYVASYMRWVYFRRKSICGPFDIYSDIDSRIRHHGRVFRRWLGLTLLEMIAGFINIILGIVGTFTTHVNPMAHWSIIVGCFASAMGVGFLLLTLRAWRQAARLKRERVLLE